MAVIVVSLLVLVPLALLGWDLSRTKKANEIAAPSGFAPGAGNTPSDTVHPNAS